MAIFVSNKLVLAIAASMLFAAPLSAQGSSFGCDPDLDRGFNASGSANTTIRDTTWTFTRYVDFNRSGDSFRGSINEPIIVKTTPKIDFKNQQYDACVVVPSLIFQNETRKLPINDDGSCSTFLNPTCVQTLNSQIDDKNFGPNFELQDDYCQTFFERLKIILRSFESTCPPVGDLTMIQMQFQNPALNTSTCAIKGSNERDNTLISYPKSLFEDADHDKDIRALYYNQAIGAPLPVFMAIRKFGTEVDPKQKIHYLPTVCIPADKVAAGSLDLDNKVVGGSAAGANPGSTAGPSPTSKVTGAGTAPSADPTGGSSKPVDKPAAAGRAEVSRMAVYGIVGVVSVLFVLGLGI